MSKILNHIVCLFSQNTIGCYTTNDIIKILNFSGLLVTKKEKKKNQMLYQCNKIKVILNRMAPKMYFPKILLFLIRDF